MRRQQSRAGILPMLDLLFILLFSLLAMSETKTTTSKEAVRIRLPEVEPGESETANDERTTIVLVLDAESRILLDDEVLETREALDARLAKFIPEECQVEIHGDTKADHGTSVALLQHLRQKGFGSVVLLATGNREGAWR